MRLNMSRNRCLFIGLLLGLFFEPTRCGVQPAVASEAPQFPPAIAITGGKTDQGYPYMFGGISSNEREILEGRAKDFNLMLVFADKSGPYLSDVQIKLAGAKTGQILAITVDGPWFFIQLPGGVYEVTATFDGQARQVKNMRVVTGKLTKYTLVWDAGQKPEPLR